MSQSLLKAEHIKISFGNVHALRDVSLEILHGEIHCLAGENGCGKSTIIKIISGVYQRDGGTIEFNGQKIDKISPIDAINLGIQVIYQDFSLFPNMTIAENMALADNKGKFFNLRPGKNKQRIDFYRESLRTLGLGLEDKMGVQVGSLSGGQRQALALLMATMTPIDFLILDEHTAALDPKTAEIIMELTDQVVKEKKVTTIMVTHNLRYAVEYGNRLIMMHEGKAILDKAGEEKKTINTEEIMAIFNRISVECGN